MKRSALAFAPYRVIPGTPWLRVRAATVSETEARARMPPAMVIRKARSLLFQKSRWVGPPQALLRTISTGMKMPEEPQTMRRSENSSRVRAVFESPRSDSARAV